MYLRKEGRANLPSVEQKAKHFAWGSSQSKANQSDVEACQNGGPGCWLVFKLFDPGRRWC